MSVMHLSKQVKLIIKFSLYTKVEKNDFLVKSVIEKCFLVVLQIKIEKCDLLTHTDFHDS